MHWWLHGAFINLRGAKISKSTGGGITIDDLMDRGYHPLVYRYLRLQAHYRSPVEFSWEAMDAARSGLHRLLDRDSTARSASAGSDSPPRQQYRRYMGALDEAVSDDLNTAKALAVASAASRDTRLAATEVAALAAGFEPVLAIGLADLESGDLDVTPHPFTRVEREEIDRLLGERRTARNTKQFAEADVLRNRLAAMGVLVEDHPDGTSTWHPVKP